MQQTKKFKMVDAISPYLAVSCGLSLYVQLFDVNPIHFNLIISSIHAYNPKLKPQNKRYEVMAS